MNDDVNNSSGNPRRWSPMKRNAFRQWKNAERLVTALRRRNAPVEVIESATQDMVDAHEAFLSWSDAG